MSVEQTFQPAYKYAHKFFEPRAFGGAIDRAGLLDRMFADNAARVVLLQGPAGHGKSTLMQQANARCRQQGMVVGWLTLDEADNDLRRLGMHLHALVLGMRGSAGGNAAISGKPSARSVLEDSGSRADGFIAHLLEFDEPVALFLDDFHALSNRSVLNFFKDFLEHLPDQVYVVIGSRSVPDIGLARQMVNKQAIVLRAEELRFSAGEVRAFFAGEQDLEIREEEFQAIYRKTEGWPAALQLFRLSLASPNVRGSLVEIDAHQPRELAEYLADNVLELQPPEVQQFLLHSSPLTRLNGELCDEVLGRKDSQQLLQQLERSGLFVRSLDVEQNWFSYHALFASFLQDQMREEDPAQLKKIHHRAAEWFLARGLHEPAMGHAVEAGSYSLAADVLDAWSSRLVALGHLITVESWYEVLPLDEVRTRPDLIVKIAWALCFLRRHQKLKPVVALLEKLPDREGAETRPDIVRSMLAMLDDNIVESGRIISRVDVRNCNLEGFRAFEVGAAANLHGYLEMTRGELESAREILSLARAYGETANAGFSLGYSISTFCMNLIVQGQLPEALSRLRQASDEAWMRLDDSVSSAVITACQIQALYECGEVNAAASRFEQARESVSNFSMLDYCAMSFIVMSRIYEMRGQPLQALEILDQADSIGHISLWPRMNRVIAWERVRRLLIRGELDRAKAVASRLEPGDQALPKNWISYTDDTEGDAIGGARLALHCGRCDEALLALEAELILARKQGRVRRQVRLLVLMSLARSQDNDGDEALRSFTEALVLAREAGFVRCILDEGPMVLPLLKAAHESAGKGIGGGSDPARLQAYVGRLLDAAGEPVGSSQGADFQVLEPLTEREKKILILLADGTSNEEIARQLFVSRNTIKFHLKNVYSKLAVNNRLQAINAARAMGLVP